MAYITPDSDVILLMGVPLTPDYINSIYFDGRGSQATYFQSNFTKTTLSKLSYIRVNQNRIRITGNAETFYPYNYMMFKNTAYGSKWFYAFILKAHYVNDNTTELEFEIDELQTWLKDMTLRSSFVERETTATDNIGEHLAPEPVDLGNIISDAILDTGYFDDYLAVVAYVPNLPHN